MPVKGKPGSFPAPQDPSQPKIYLNRLIFNPQWTVDGPWEARNFQKKRVHVEQVSRNMN